MSCQAFPWPKVAAVACAPVILPTSVSPVLQVFSRFETRRKSAPLRVGAKLEPLSGPLRASFRFFRPPLPAPRSAFLAISLPEGRDTGLPRSARVPERVRCCLWPGVATSPYGHSRDSISCTLTFWLLLVSIFSNFQITSPATVQISSPCLFSLASRRPMLSDLTSPRGSVLWIAPRSTLSGQLHTRPLPTSRVPVGYGWRNTRLDQR
jgi:hypothetical protein